MTIDKKMTTLTLIMIVKNESKIIERCLDSVKKYIDYIVISDTGSTDNTVELIENYLTNNNIKGKVYHDQWENFGVNRSKSVTNGQHWLDEEKINKNTNYFITIDADMILMIDPLFDKTILKQCDAWLINQKNQSLKYYNIRLFRSDLPYKCIGVTHEYWGCDGNITNGRLETMFIDDIGDGGAKADKFTRDIKLLKKGIEDEPNNHRYYFYLAQSYADLGEPENAIIWYQKRIDAGQWQEEVFISYLRIGELYMKVKQPEKAIQNWIKGYDFLPIRSETLARLAGYYRDRKELKAAYMFVKEGLTIPYPKDLLLFIEYAIYDYMFLVELSIIGYYINKKHLGILSSQSIILNKDVPTHIKQAVYSNNFFYIDKLSKQYKKHITFPISVEQHYLPSSACFLLNKKRIKGVVRAVNYSINDQFQYSVRDENQHVKTKNYWTEIEDDKVVVCYEINNKVDPIRSTHIKGLEDMRICYVGDKLYGVAVTFEHGKNNHPSVCLTCFEKENNRYVINKIFPITYKDQECQKNWVLFSDKNKLFAVYSHHPFTILEIDTTNGNYNVILERFSNFDLSWVRGSAIPVRIPSLNVWLFLVHEVVQRDTRKYFHRFLTYSNDWKLMDISEPFYLNNFFVEFTLSIMYDKDKQNVMIPYSTRDNTTEMVTIAYSDIKWLPRSLDEIKEEIKKGL